jgi:Meiotically up-regulated gene 113
MKKEHILSEIRRTALANGGTPLGRGRFLAETGIREADWLGRYWVRWSEAVLEAGFAPNSLTAARTDEAMLEKLASLVRELQHFPVVGELRMKSRSDPSFPSFKTFERFGPKAKQVGALAEFARERGYQDVVEACARVASKRTTGSEQTTEGEGATVAGWVYLMKHGSRREFKIGRTNNPIRREGEVGIEMPQRLEPIHVIETDDPPGIESYWHRRFAEKRLKGEWFALTSQDVRAFKRWRKIF